MPNYEQTTIVISVATIDHEPLLHDRILQSMQRLSELLRDQMGCIYVSPILQNWPQLRWQLIGEVRQDCHLGPALQRFFALEELQALKACAATDCLIFRPVQRDVSCFGQAKSAIETEFIPSCSSTNSRVADVRARDDIRSRHASHKFP